jgi:hypothetical protein
VDSESTGHANFNLGCFHYQIAKTLSCNDAKRKHFRLHSLSLIIKKHHDTIIFNTVYYGPNHIYSLDISSILLIDSIAVEQIDDYHPSDQRNFDSQLRAGIA